MRICYAVSEVLPYSKTGGLGDVAAALPQELARLGHDVRVIAPLHVLPGEATQDDLPLFEPVRDVEVELGARRFRYSLRAFEPRGRRRASVFLVDAPQLYHRQAVYTNEPDEPLRFAFLCRAVFESCQRMAWSPDVIHCNDWHTALIPLMRDSVYGWDALFRGSRTLMTIHNIAYQGIFPAATIDELGLGSWVERFDEHDRREGRINFLRTGVAHAHTVSTVSPTYAEEIQGDELGMGLAPDLRARRGAVVGILNGVDYEVWDPERDGHIPHPYSASDPTGKHANKRRLLERLGMDPQGDAPLAGIVSRLVEQKGFDLCVDVLPELLETGRLRLVVLGQGQPQYEELFDSLARRYPHHAAFRRDHDEALAHWIEAASDLFLMPSRYEPCGLNQLFSLRYGTIPVVRRTGGLADSVRPFDREADAGTGFVFEPYTPSGLRQALDQALAAWAERDRWRRLVARAMAENFSWAAQARLYAELYARMLRD